MELLRDLSMEASRIGELLRICMRALDRRSWATVSRLWGSSGEKELARYLELPSQSLRARRPGTLEPLG
jgi:hypothetical protein